MHSAYGIRVSFKSAQKQTIPCVALPTLNRRRMLSHCERPPRRCCVGFGHGAACLGGFLDAHRRVEVCCLSRLFRVFMDPTSRLLVLAAPLMNC